MKYFNSKFIVFPIKEFNCLWIEDEVIRDRECYKIHIALKNGIIVKSTPFYYMSDLENFLEKIKKVIKIE